MDVVIASAVRTATGKFLGSLKPFTAPQLGAIVIREAVARAGIDPAVVEECIMGNVVSAGLGQAPARQAALRGGLPDRVAALTINKVCGSGLKAVMLAAQSIRAGDNQAVVAGGQESMSSVPFYVYGYRGGVKFGVAMIGASAALYRMRGRGDVVRALGRGAAAGLRAALGHPVVPAGAPREGG